MSRSGYDDDVDDNWSLIRYRGMVTSAVRGRRGQALLKDILIAMNAMPVKQLIAHDVADYLAREIVWENDECGPWKETPEQRFARMRKWVHSQIREPLFDVVWC